MEENHEAVSPTGTETLEELLSSPIDFKLFMSNASSDCWSDLLEEAKKSDFLNELAEAITTEWKGLTEADAIALSQKITEGSAINKNDYFPFVLCLHMVKADLSEASILLIYSACARAFKGQKKGLVSSKGLSPARKFISEHTEEFLKLPFENLWGEKKKKVTNVLLQAIFRQASPKLTPEIQEKSLNAMIKKLGVIEIYDTESEMPEIITEAMSEWPLSMIIRLNDLLEYLPEQTRSKLKEILCHHEGVERSEISCLDQSGEKVKDGLSLGTFKEALSVVEDYYDSLESLLDQTRKEVAELSSELTESRQLVETKTTKNNALKERLEVLSTKLSDLEISYEVVKKDLGETEEKLNKINSQLENERKAHEDTRVLFCRKVDSESGNQIRIFKEKIAKDLFSTYQDMQRIARNEMTLQRAEMVKHALLGVFAKLEKLGIEFRGK